MKEKILRPSASALLNSLRAIGYSFSSALADILDNSITAGANRISIKMSPDPEPYVAIVDNGHGMPEDTLIEAMRHGGMGPGVRREAHDLGRFGLGLKTATLSQCRQLIVASVAGSAITAACWDLDEIETRDEWVLKILSKADIQALPHINELTSGGNGTLVVWKKFDRALAGEPAPAKALGKLVDDSRDHLELVFHRFVHPDDKSDPVLISINGLPLKRIDPFLTANKHTESLPLEQVRVDGHLVGIQAYILPHLSNIKDSDLRMLGGTEGLRQSQGFYVYRNRRLLSYGTWFRLMPRDELSKLARVRVDVPNGLDHLWNLDVKKSSANPPEQVRQALRRIIDRIAERSSIVFKDRRRRPGGTVIHLWERRPVRGGTSYLINREHPFVEEIQRHMEADDQKALERLLRMLEVGLPAASIYADMAADHSVEMPLEQAEAELRQKLEEWLESASNDRHARDAILGALPKLDPFSMYPSITKKLLEEAK